MATESQIAANRANALKSTGPRTPEGKAVSRFNNLQTGIEAQSEIIRGEDPDALAALTAAFHAEYQPATPTEANLVDAIAHHAWLQRRLRKVEAETWAGERKRMQAVTHNEMTNGEVFAHHVGAFSRIQRRIDSTERNLHRSLDTLRRLQAERKAQDIIQPEAQPPAEPIPTPSYPARPQPPIGFGPSHSPAQPQVFVLDPPQTPDPTPGGRL
jgi:hypothetical protein